MVHVLIVAEDGIYGSCITADFNSISRTPANADSNAAFQFCIVKVHVYTTSTGNCYVMSFIFQGHVGGGGGSKDLPENSGLDHAGTTTVWWDSFAKEIVVEEEWKENF